MHYPGGLAAANRFGHCRLEPALFTPPEAHKQRPRILTELTSRLRDYYRNPALLPTLNAANGSTRDQRSERREACLALLGAMIHYTDLVTLRIGRPAGSDFSGLTLDYLADRARIPLRRAQRACHDLVAAGVIKVHRVCEQVAGDRFIGLAAIRTLSVHLFQLFGLGKQLADERRKAYRRNRDEPTDETDKGRAGLAMAAIRHRINNPASPAGTLDQRRAALRAAVTRPPDR